MRQVSAFDTGRIRIAPRMPLLFFGVTVAYVVGFAAMLAAHAWLWDGAGRLASAPTALIGVILVSGLIVRRMLPTPSPP
jgi:ABC-type uncharacterized transport system YnjBCD permease subunit